MAIRSQRVEIPPRMQSRLDTLRRRLWMIKIGEGILAGMFGLLASYFIVFLVDRFWETPAAARGGLLVLGAVGWGVAFPLVLHRWVWGTRRLEQIARLVRRRYPAVGEQLLGIIELAQAEREALSCSDDLLRAAVAQVDEEVAARELDDAAPSTLLRKWSWATGLVMLLVLITLTAVPAAGLNAMARWLMPWRQTQRYTFAQLNALPGEMIVPYAEEFSLAATLKDETAWKPATGAARFGEERPIRADRRGDTYDFALPPRKQPGTLKVSVGDARHQVQVRPLPRPELTEIAAHVTLPQYLRYSHALTHDARGGTTSVVVGSRVRFEASATRHLESASMDGKSQQRVGSTIVTDEQQVTDSFRAALEWTDEYGLTGKRPLVLTVQAKEDEPPTLTCEGGMFEQVVLEEDVLTFEIQAKDDFGVKSVGMTWAGVENPYRNPNPAVGEKLLLDGDPEETMLAAEATFSAKREGIPPQTLRVRMFAVDYLPDRERVYSPEFIIHVLSPEEHNIWLTRQLARWFRTATEVYDRERMLHDENVQLRNLLPEELDRPENRRRIQQQATAEQANARRLEAVADAGELLIREALKNEEFNTETLETWAAMLNALQEIAGQRMPSVADLLADAANTPAAKSVPRPGNPQTGNPAQQNPQVGNNRSGMPGSPGAPKEGQAPPVPSIADVESGFNKTEPSAGQNQSPSPASPGRLTLPVTTLLGGGPPPEPQQDRPPAAETVARAVEEQQDLLDEFGRVADELQRILDNLEGSTFVKRFKAVSRRELELASDLNTSMVPSFGIQSHEIGKSVEQRAGKLAERQRAHSDTVWLIQSDLHAYFNRVRDGKFKVVLDEMAQENPVGGMADLGRFIRSNRSGQALASAEYWADTLDRWAEQLVGPACKVNGQCPPGPAGSLPPHVVLAVMRILEKEINLREETRTAEQSREALAADTYGQRADALSGTQHEIGDLVLEVIGQIEELETAASFTVEVALLDRVHEVMVEAAGILAQPNTGGEAIAAETEAIELLLQAKRSNPNGGGGGGGMTPGGGSGGDTDQTALALLGEGDELQAHAQIRSTAQATGLSGREVPAEFRPGIDLGRIGIKKQTNEDARVLEPPNRLGHLLFRAHDVEPPFGRHLLATFRHERGLMGSDFAGDRQHVRRAGQLEIDRYGHRLRKHAQVAFLDVPSVLA